MQLAIIGGGPAGLRAAEIAAAAGVPATVFDAKPSVGRKFLVAGKGGLNLTNAEPREKSAERYSAGPWPRLLAECDAEALRAWAARLGVETFVGASGRVYPQQMKAAPLLRRWVHRLREAGVRFAMNHRWSGVRRGKRWELTFAVPAADPQSAAPGVRSYEADAVILALGGASWPETGSDGAWIATVRALGVDVAPLQAANCGWEVAWPAEVLAHEGAPLKNIAASSGASVARGELLITRGGLEGGAIYALGPVLRALAREGRAAVSIDFKPALAVAQLAAKLAPSTRVSLLEAARRWNVSAPAAAILRSFSPALGSPDELAHAVKHCRIPLLRPRPIAEAISSAGGVRWSDLDDALMLRSAPGVFVAGEMIDWEAPTGGYLLQGCFATGTRAARGAVEWLGAIGAAQRS